MTRQRGRPKGGITVDENGKPTRTYKRYAAMIQRCYSPSSHIWKYYGGRGIRVCHSWRADYSAFLADMGEVPPGKWLDRIDNDMDYGPGNCRWVTPKESANNRRCRQPDPNSLPSRCKAAGLPFMLVYLRVRAGWSEQRALSTPKMKRGRQLGWRKQ